MTSSVPMIANMTVRSTTVVSKWDTLVYPSRPSISPAKLRALIAPMVPDTGISS